MKKTFIVSAELILVVRLASPSLRAQEWSAVQKAVWKKRLDLQGT